MDHCFIQVRNHELNWSISSNYDTNANFFVRATPFITYWDPFTQLFYEDLVFQQIMLLVIPI